MVSERMLGLGTARSVIRELFEYGNIISFVKSLLRPKNSIVLKNPRSMK